MKITPSPKSWIYFFLLVFIEAAIALGTLLKIPADPANSFLFGLSASRLVMVAATVGIAFVAAWGAGMTHFKRAWREKYLNAQNFPNAYQTSVAFAALISLLASVGLFLLRYYDPTRFLPLFTRAKPLGLLIILVAAEFALWGLLLLRGVNTENWQKRLFRAPLVALLSLYALFLFVVLSRIGLTPDTAYWAQPGVVLQGWQFLLALIIGALAYLFFLKFSFSKSDLFIVFLIWAAGAAIWWRVPMDVLKHSFYAPYAYPLGKPLPYSDAGFYDYLSQGLLLGSGFFSRIPPRPLYVVFLAGLRALVGMNNYEGIMLGQTMLYAFFPVVLYLLGKRIHSRAAGVLAAFLGIFREWTNLLVSSQTRVSNSRMTLTDLPTALVLSLVALLIISWLQRDDRHPARLFRAAGIFGVLLLLRTQSLLILPLLLLLILIVFFPNWKKWAQMSAVLIVGIALVITPWLVRNASITGKITFDDPNQLAVLSSQYKTEGNLNWTDFDFENESLSNSLLSFALQNPGYVARFIATHFLATEINGLLVLPHIQPFPGFQEPVNVYWTAWDGHPSFANQLLILLYLAVIALGIGAAWRRFRWVGLTPLLFNLGYALSNGVARFSGWRYDLPADWVAYFYFGIGFIEALILLGALFGADAEKIRFTPRQKSAAPGLYSSVFFGAVLLLVGASPLIIERVIPPHFETLSKAEIINLLPPVDEAQEAFLAQEDVQVMQGRLIYPRYFAKGIGISSANPWPSYAVRDFARMGFVLLNDGNTQIVLPVKHMPEQFPSGEDVILFGCQQKGYTEARLLYVVDDGETFISERGFAACIAAEE